MLHKVSTILQDPAWWFTTVLVGIIVGVIAAFGKDILRDAIALLSSRVRARRDERRRNEDRVARAIASDPIKLTFSMSLALFYAILFTLTTLGFLSLAILATTVSS